MSDMDLSPSNQESPAQDQDSTPSIPTSSEQPPAQAESVREKIERFAREKNASRAPGEASETPRANSAPNEPVVPPAYNPNYKFKVSNQEREMDEWIRATIKDAETEKKARELFEKAHGLDVIKPKMLEERNARKQLENQFAGLQSRVAPVEQALAKGDLGEVFKRLNLDDQKVFQYAWNRLQYLEQPPEYRNAVEAQKAAEARAMQLEQQVQSSGQQLQAQAVHARTSELKTVLEKPEIKSVADAFDARTGMPGSFENEVIKRGQLAYYTAGKDLTAQEAVSEVLSLLGNTVPAQSPEPQAQGNMQNPQHAAPPQAAAPAPREKPPVIPVVQGKPQSPATRAVRSTDDLRRLAREKASLG